MRYFVDTEFIVAHWGDLSLISVGVIAEDGRTFYREIEDAPLWNADAFAKDHVIPQLHMRQDDQHDVRCPEPRSEHDCPVTSPQQLRLDFLEFVAADQQIPEFWADFGAYDYVILSETFGGMEMWPTFYPCYFNDIQQWARQLGAHLPPVQIADAPYAEHHALYDAMTCLAKWQMLQGLEQAIARSVLKPALAQKLTKSGLALP